MYQSASKTRVWYLELKLMISILGVGSGAETVFVETNYLCRTNFSALYLKEINWPFLFFLSLTTYGKMSVWSQIGISFRKHICRTSDKFCRLYYDFPKLHQSYNWFDLVSGGMFLVQSFGLYFILPSLALFGHLTANMFLYGSLASLQLLTSLMAPATQHR